MFFHVYTLPIYTYLQICTFSPWHLWPKNPFKPFHPIFTHEPKYFTQSWIVRIVLNSISGLNYLQRPPGEGAGGGLCGGQVGEQEAEGAVWGPGQHQAQPNQVEQITFKSCSINILVLSENLIFSYVPFSDFSSVASHLG
jgi:hypothetical protein